jgi:hypothetical protein
MLPDTRGRDTTKLVRLIPQSRNIVQAKSTLNTAQAFICSFQAEFWNFYSLLIGRDSIIYPREANCKEMYHRSMIERRYAFLNNEIINDMAISVFRKACGGSARLHRDDGKRDDG